MWIMPLSLCSVLAKVLTYWSYDAVPVAIAHTCKVRTRSKSELSLSPKDD